MITDFSLPPCKVCRDPSTGVHYGVLSCIACKAFFGRYIKGKNRQVCPTNRKCKIRGVNKNSCAPCRYKKCLEVGMSTKASKTGRYSLQKRDELNREVQEMEKVNAENVIEKGPNGESLDEVISAILKAYDCVPSHVFASQKTLDDLCLKYKEEYNLRQGLFGKMEPVANEEFEEIFTSTGLDIDNRFQHRNMYINSVRAWFDKLISFVKSVPGFKNLSFQDQFNLIKYNRFEFWFLGSYKGFNGELEISVNPNGTTFHKEELKKTFPGNTSEILFDVSDCLKRRQLTPEEVVIVQTMTLFFPDRAPLEDRPAVERLQHVMMSCLERLVSKRPDHRSRVRAMGHAVDAMTIIRSVCHVDEVEVARNTFAGQMQLLKLELLKGWMDVGLTRELNLPPTQS